MQSNTSSSVSPGNGHCRDGGQQGARGPPPPLPDLEAPTQHSPRPPASHRAAHPAPTSPQPACRPPGSALRGPGTLGCRRRCSSGPQSRSLQSNIHTDASVVSRIHSSLCSGETQRPSLRTPRTEARAEPCPTLLAVGTRLCHLPNEESQSQPSLHAKVTQSSERSALS